MSAEKIILLKYYKILKKYLILKLIFYLTNIDQKEKSYIIQLLNKDKIFVLGEASNGPECL